MEFLKTKTLDIIALPDSSLAATVHEQKAQFSRQMITQVRVKNFRAIADETVQLGQLTVLVGRNGAGKSSFVDVFRFVRDAVAGLDDAVVQRHGIVALRRYAPTRPFDVEIELFIETSSWNAKYGFCIGSKPEGEYAVKRESCEVWEPGGRRDGFTRTTTRLTISGERFPGGQEQTRTYDPTALALSSVAIFSPFFSRLRNYLRSLNFCAIFPITLRKPQEPSPAKLLNEHGDNLASVLRRLRQARGARYDEFKIAFNNVIGGIQDVRVSQTGGFLITELQHQMGSDNSAWFDLSQESDGTLRILGLLVALYSGPRPGKFLAVEEPELTLHPGALGVVSDVLRESSASGQLIVTTQSPDLISRFNADDLRVVERDANGITSIGMIDETQRQAVNDELFKSGDLLRIEGLRRQSTAR